MRATGGELGWLTWPLDQGDKPGVSIAPTSPPTPTFPLGICPRIKCSGRAPLRASAAETVDRLTCVVGCVYSVHVRFL